MFECFEFVFDPIVACQSPEVLWAVVHCIVCFKWCQWSVWWLIAPDYRQVKLWYVDCQLFFCCIATKFSFCALRSTRGLRGVCINARIYQSPCQWKIVTLFHTGGGHWVELEVRNVMFECFEFVFDRIVACQSPELLWAVVHCIVCMKWCQWSVWWLIAPDYRQWSSDMSTASCFSAV